MNRRNTMCNQTKSHARLVGAVVEFVAALRATTEEAELSDEDRQVIAATGPIDQPCTFLANGNCPKCYEEQGCAKARQRAKDRQSDAETPDTASDVPSEVDIAIDRGRYDGQREAAEATAASLREYKIGPLERELKGCKLELDQLRAELVKATTGPVDEPCIYLANGCPECDKDLECSKNRRRAEQAAPPEAPTDETPDVTGGIPREVYDRIVGGVYCTQYEVARATAAAMRGDGETVKAELERVRGALAATDNIARAKQKRLDLAWAEIAELQDAKPPATSSKTMPKKPGLYWVYDRTMGVVAPDFDPWNAVLFINVGDEPGEPDVAVRLYRILRHCLSPMDYPWQAADLTFSPRINPSKLVLEEPASETP